jgi:predicted methyltransferase
VTLRTRFLLLALPILLMAAISPLSSATPSWAEASAPAALQAAIAGPQRSEANKARDKYRHPLATLTFF